MVMPCTPCSASAFLTSSSLKCRMMASIFFMGRSPVGLVNAQRRTQNAEIASERVRFFVLHFAFFDSPARQVATDQPTVSSNKNIPLFAMLAKVETLDFLLLGHSQAHRGVEHLEQ